MSHQKLRAISKVVKEHFGVIDEEFNGRSRRRELVVARHFYMHFADKHTKCSLTKIGAFCGRNAHATVLHGLRVIENGLETDREYRDNLRELEPKVEIELEGLEEPLVVVENPFITNCKQIIADIKKKADSDGKLHEYYPMLDGLNTNLTLLREFVI